MLKIIIASNNPNKIQEYKEILNSNDIELLSLKDLNIVSDPIENGKTFKENSLIKAKEVAKYTDLPIIADDSGIVIKKLGDNFPGIYSKRYQEQNGGAYKNNLRLIKEVANSPAFFTCHITLLNLDGEHHFEGKMNGKISSVYEGENGFGYDPIFIKNGYKHTIACLSKEEKNKISHRYKATEKLKKFLIKKGYIN